MNQIPRKKKKKKKKKKTQKKKKKKKQQHKMPQKGTFPLFSLLSRER